MNKILWRLYIQRAKIYLLFALYCIIGVYAFVGFFLVIIFSVNNLTNIGLHSSVVLKYAINAYTILVVVNVFNIIYVIKTGNELLEYLNSKRIVKCIDYIECKKLMTEIIHIRKTKGCRHCYCSVCKNRENECTYCNCDTCSENNIKNILDCKDASIDYTWKK